MSAFIGKRKIEGEDKKPEKKVRMDDIEVVLEKLKDSKDISEISSCIKGDMESLSKSDSEAFATILADENIKQHIENNKDDNFKTGLYIIKSSSKIVGMFYLSSEIDKDNNMLCYILTYVLRQYRGKGISGKAKAYFIKNIYPKMEKDKVLVSDPKNKPAFSLGRPIKRPISNILLLSEISWDNINSLKSLQKFNVSSGYKFILFDVNSHQVIFSYSNPEIKKYSDKIQNQVDNILSEISSATYSKEKFAGLYFMIQEEKEKKKEEEFDITMFFESLKGDGKNSKRKSLKKSSRKSKRRSKSRRKSKKMSKKKSKRKSKKKSKRQSK